MVEQGRKALEEEKEAMMEIAVHEDDIIELNVGNTHDHHQV